MYISNTFTGSSVIKRQVNWGQPETTKGTASNIAQDGFTKSIAPPRFTGEQEEVTTKLLRAVIAGDIKAINLLAKPDINLNTRDINNGWTPLTLAASQGRIKVVQELVRLGAAINTPDEDGKTPLHWAAMKGHSETAQVLANLNKAVLTQADEEGYTPLHYAANKGHTETAQVLANLNKAVLTQADKKGATPLHWAANKGHTETAEVLANLNKAVLTQADEDGNTPLHRAAMNGHTETAELLANLNKAVLTQADKKGATPLHWAAMKGHTETAEVLANLNKAVLTQADIFGHAPRHTAAKIGHSKTAKLLEQLENDYLNHLQEASRTCSVLDAIDNQHDTNNPYHILRNIPKREKRTDETEKMVVPLEVAPEKPLKKSEPLPVQSSTQGHNAPQDPVKQAHDPFSRLLSGIFKQPAKVVEGQGPVQSQGPTLPQIQEDEALKPAPPVVDWEKLHTSQYADWDKPTPPPSILSDNSTVRPESSASQASFAHRPHPPVVDKPLQSDDRASLLSDDSSIRPGSSYSQASFAHRPHPLLVNKSLKSEAGASSHKAPSIASSKESQDSASTVSTVTSAITPDGLNTAQTIFNILQKWEGYLTDEQVGQLVPHLDKKVAKQVSALLKQNQPPHLSKKDYQLLLLDHQRTSLKNSEEQDPHGKLPEFWEQVRRYFSKA